MHDLYRNNISRNWKSGVRSEISRGRNLLKYEFCNKSFRKNEPLTSWTLFSPLIKTLGERASNFENTYVEKSVQLVKGSSFRNDLLQNPYFKKYQEEHQEELADLREKRRIAERKRRKEELDRRELERERERLVRKSFYVPYAHHYDPRLVYFLPHFSLRFLL